MNTVLHSLSDLHEWTASFVANLKGYPNHATIVTLSGDLGAGKTELVRSCARHFGISEDITSPTFVIQKEYELSHPIFNRFIHIDAYRLESASELEYLGWKELITNPQTVIFLEWPEMVVGIDLPDSVNLTLAIGQNQSRTLSQGQ